MTRPHALSIWTVYDNPTDYPGKFVARMFDGEQPTPNVIICDSLEQLREILAFQLHLTPLCRSPEDDPKIVETWL